MARCPLSSHITASSSSKTLSFSLNSWRMKSIRERSTCTRSVCLANAGFDYRGRTWQMKAAKLMTQMVG